MPRKLHKSLLWLCLFAFLGRVVGQVLVVLEVAPWLPPMDAWQSGLLPYRLLLASQILILFLMTAVNISETIELGPFSRRGEQAQRVLRVFSLLYAAAMIVRLISNALVGPGVLHDIIPITFHFVLASYLFLLSRNVVSCAPASASGGAAC